MKQRRVRSSDAAEVVPWQMRATKIAPYAAAPLLLLPLGMSNRSLSLSVVALTMALGAYGVVLSFGLVGSLSIGIAVAWGSSALLAAFLSGDVGWPFPLVAPAAIAVAVLVSVVVALPSARLKGHYFVIITFATAEVLFIAGSQMRSIHRGGIGISTFANIAIGPITVESRGEMYVFALICLAAVMALLSVVRRSKFGQRLISIRENEELAISLGVDAKMWKLAAFGLSGVPLGLAGLVYAYNLHSVTIEAFNIHTAILLLLIAILGGVRSATGPILAAFFVTLVPEMLGLSPMMQQILYGAIVIVAILAMPHGLAEEVQTRIRQRYSPLRDSYGAHGARNGEPG